MMERWLDLLYWIVAGFAAIALLMFLFAVVLFISNWRKVREDIDENYRRRRR